MIAVGLDQRDLQELLAVLNAGPKEVKAATRRAVGAGASFLRVRMKEYIKTGGQGWEPLHPITHLANFNELVSWKLNAPYRQKVAGTSKADKATLLGFLATNNASGAIAKATLAEARSDLKGHLRQTARGTRGFLGKLAGVILYHMSPAGSDPTAVVGVLAEKTGQKARYFFEQFQEGGSMPGRYHPTFSQPSMSRYWGALGLHLRKGTRLQQPPRDIVVSVWERDRQAVQDTIRAKFEQRMLEPKDSQP